MGQKAGDNSQVLALAEGLGWPFEIKRFVFNRYELLAYPFGGTLAGVDRAQSDPLIAPWPDIVISAGRRNEPICKWIKNAAGDHRVRLVHVGRPWSSLDWFDLIVTTPQYRLPVRANVLHNRTPLHRVTAERMASHALDWAPRLDHLPRPFVAVAVGGSSGPYALDQAAAERLARQASVLARSMGGSLLVTTSARTPQTAIEALERTIDCPAFLYRWQKDAVDNPYFAFLGLADAIIATGDSMSMVAEACSTGKPVHIFDLGEGVGSMRRQVAAAAAKAERSRLPWWRREPAHLKAFLYKQMMRFGPERLSRDIRIILDEMVDTGRATWLGEPFAHGVEAEPLDCLQRAVARVHALVDHRETARPGGRPKQTTPKQTKKPADMPSAVFVGQSS